MLLHQIELVPGESIRVGHLIVTLVCVEDNTAELHVEDPDNGTCWNAPLDLPGCETEELVC